MQTWPVRDARARFSKLLEACINDGPQIVTRHGTEAAVLVPIDEWRRLQASALPSLKQLLLSDQARFGLAIPARDKARSREVETR